MTEAKTKQKTEMKRSKLVITLYVLAGLMGILGCFMIYYSISYVLSYYSGYGMSVSDGVLDVIQYVISNSISYFVYGVVFFGLAVILKKVNMMQFAMAGQECTAEVEDAEEDQEETEAEKEEAEETSEEEESQQEDKAVKLEPEGVL